jgi:colicin import membrane protein
MDARKTEKPPIGTTIMKQKTLLLTLAAVLALGLAGCSKNESVTPAADDANKAASSAADAAAKTAEAAKVEAAKVAEATKAEAAKTAEAAKVEAAKTAEAAKVEAAKADQATKAEAAKVAEAAKAQGLIDKAKSLVAEGKFSDASSVLQQLTGLSLTDEQKKLVDGLKEQIQKALAAKAAADAAGAAGNLLRQ